MMEYRVVCTHYPADGHQLHRWDKRSKQTAEQTVLDLNHKAGLDPYHFYAKCAPYEVETREVTDWAGAYDPDTD